MNSETKERMGNWRRSGGVITRARVRNGGAGATYDSGGVPGFPASLRRRSHASELRRSRWSWWLLLRRF
ncbi:hypothetical protein Hanom_Chr07g00644351 [Helianthus anomalus]